jgi:hypothetical protein
VKQQRFAKVRVLYGGSEVTNSPRTFALSVNSTRDTSDPISLPRPCGHLPPLRQDMPEENSTIVFSKIVCQERLGGLIKSFERRMVKKLNPPLNPAAFRSFNDFDSHILAA